jgi:hypothetical protein
LSGEYKSVEDEGILIDIIEKGSLSEHRYLGKISSNFQFLDGKYLASFDNPEDGDDGEPFSFTLA